MSTSPLPADQPAGRTAITGVRVFDGHGITAPRTVVIDGSLIGDDADGATVADGDEAVLLPGLIDAHVHLTGVADLETLSAHGITTALDMACWPPELVDSLRHRHGLTDIRSAGTSATSPGSTHSRLPHFPADGLVADPERAEPFVAARAAEGSDYIKIISDVPGPTQAVLDALVAAAHDWDLRTVAHAVNLTATMMALDAGADVITHAPLDRPLDDETCARMLREGTVSVPTLTMMLGVSANAFGDYQAARSTVGALHRAGVPILAGTDANSAPGVPAQVPHGTSLHQELELLIDAGLSTLDALRAATVLPARHFGLDDRGAVTPGLRADLVMVDGDPLADIRATRAIRRIWCAGTERRPAPASPTS